MQHRETDRMERRCRLGLTRTNWLPTLSCSTDWGMHENNDGFAKRRREDHRRIAGHNGASKSFSSAAAGCSDSAASVAGRCGRDWRLEKSEWRTARARVKARLTCRKWGLHTGQQTSANRTIPLAQCIGNLESPLTPTPKAEHETTAHVVCGGQR